MSSAHEQLTTVQRLSRRAHDAGGARLSSPAQDSHVIRELHRVEMLDTVSDLAHPSRRELVAQRLFDLVTALVGVVVFLVPALLIAVVVKCTNSGPVLFTQRRVGRGGREFTVYKFRTMRQGTHQEILADERARQAYRDNDFKLPPDDPRITGIGRLLRKTSLDELPQLINVIQGKMSIVGVRPLLAEEVAIRPAYDQALYRCMRPGMTGLWQVEGRSTVRSTDRLQLDRTYLENWSVWGDIKIAIRTPFALLRIGHAH